MEELGVEPTLSPHEEAMALLGGVKEDDRRRIVPDRKAEASLSRDRGKPKMSEDEFPLV